MFLTVFTIVILFLRLSKKAKNDVILKFWTERADGPPKHAQFLDLHFEITFLGGGPPAASGKHAHFRKFPSLHMCVQFFLYYFILFFDYYNDYLLMFKVYTFIKIYLMLNKLKIFYNNFFIYFLLT